MGFLVCMCYFLFVSVARAQITVSPSTTTTSTSISTASSTDQPSVLPQATKMLKIGLIMPKTNPDITEESGFDRAAGAIPMAIDLIRKDHLLDDYNFTFITKFAECQDEKAAGSTVELITINMVDALIGPTCSSAAIHSGIITAYYNIPTYLWGMVASHQLADTSRYLSTVRLTADSAELAEAFVAFMNKFGFDRFAFMYILRGQQKCKYIGDDLKGVIENTTLSDVSMTYSHQMENSSAEVISKTMEAAVKRARIFALCFANDVDRRNFFLAIYDMGLHTDEYLYVMLDTRGFGFGQRAKSKEFMDATGTVPLYIDQSEKPDGRDQDAMAAARMAVSIDFDATTSVGNISDFNKKVIERIRGWPFYCTECNSSDVAATYARYLHDAMYLYALALNRTITKNPLNIRNGRAIAQNSNVTFQGASGEVIFNKERQREAVFVVMGLNGTNSVVKFSTLKRNQTGNMTYYPESREKRIWDTRAGKKPRAVPLCGFDGNSCPEDPIRSPWVIGAVATGCVFAVITVFTSIYICWSRKREEERLNHQWQIPYFQLVKHTPKKAGSESSRSLASSTMSVATKLTIETELESEFFTLYYLSGEPVVASKHHIRLNLDKNDHADMRKLRSLDHSNLNKFLGLCLDAEDCMYMSIWKYCSRRSLQDVFLRESITMDSFVMCSLMRDILQGLNYIHNSFLEHHGHLTSSNCLVDDRWQVKLSDYGLEGLRKADRLSHKKLLWRAPELLRDESVFGTKAGDVYSFAIICSEIMSRKPAYDLDSRPETEEEIVYLVKRGGSTLCRPSISNMAEFNPAFVHLVRDCWSENVRERPTVEQVIKLMKSIVPKSNVNLMDHVFRMMESYADSLEQEVQARVRELESEKRKSDLLLYRMMPKQIAEKLKMGSSVEPETFESVTVFFSDVVSFTTLASRCTPLQVVDLLNRLYTNFDQIIDNHDVYKVETIGDGYLCVSGLPHRNGDRHVMEIADMSLEFIASLQGFRIPHIPSQTVQIRVGMHTGSVVAGVVGLTMPRYCLFGDTVNTASRMESNSKPNRIHMSGQARVAIQRFPGYTTESRGDVIIKGKGVMETFWLVGRQSSLKEELRSEART
ncbi:hypothetical protein QR680_011906 [Steinernema hermaphroditum]|uniref:Guanylate cyclase n=1 Tax=Steinernema hermaphroditum TaxID=289476 RepID=A0AA39I202_9BILA|nr:hypothetical protein QR680_011906 [Steinernema hermaphroditum]